jgi:transketolase
MLNLEFIPAIEFERIRSLSIDNFIKLKLIADMCRSNTLTVVKKAGSGHIGSSFSAMDIVVFLYYKEMNTIELGLDHQDRDIYFSSKGHDVPGFYSVLHSLGILSREKVLNLRRLGGLDGHPDVKIPGVEANSGSLGMGISKARGMAIAKNLKGSNGRIFVLTGDGELQEGQIWESLQTATHHKIHNINVIIDYNKIQSDKPVKDIIDLGNLVRKLKTFGWHVERCDGHDYSALNNVFDRFGKIEDKPKILLADTVKGKGISFMEGRTVLRSRKGLYKWHSGAPDDDSFEMGHKELLDSINDRLNKLEIKPISLEIIETRSKHRGRIKDVAEKVVNAYGEALVEFGEKRKNIVVLDADLSADCGLRPFENTFPERFIENGIAEQDMVSVAGGLALHGFLPIVNSFGVFLASRSNEQIYNNATEGTKIIYACHYAGIIPAGPGKSHQSLRDISLFGALPNCTVLQPCNATETRLIVEYCVTQATENCVIRLAIGPSPRKIQLPPDYQLEPGHGVALTQGSDAILFAYGPVMLHEALLASELLSERSFGLKVVNMPWLNRVDADWLTESTSQCDMLYVLEDHAPVGGLGDHLLNVLASSAKGLAHRRLIKLAVEGFPACGTPPETLRHHRLDGASLAERILRATGQP